MIPESHVTIGTRHTIVSQRGPHPWTSQLSHTFPYRQISVTFQHARQMPRPKETNWLQYKMQPHFYRHLHDNNRPRETSCIT